MDQHEMVALIHNGVPQVGGIWADLGAGTGNFTWALAELLGATATIYSLDRDARAITAQQRRLQTDPPTAQIVPQQADLLRPLDLPQLDGILVANLLHFIGGQAELLRRLHAQLKRGGHLLVVEYEQAMPIPWVPHPLPYVRLSALAPMAGFAAPVQVGSRRSPSSGRLLYAATAVRADNDGLGA